VWLGGRAGGRPAGSAIGDGKLQQTRKIPISGYKKMFLLFF
jgi:hypothetical protein